MSIWFQCFSSIIAVCLFVFCDYTVVRWAELTTTEGFWTWRLIAILIAAPLSTICFGLVGARMGLAAVSAYINTVVVVGGLVVGVMIRGDNLSISQKFGMGLGVVAMLLINVAGQPDNIDADADLASKRFGLAAAGPPGLENEMSPGQRRIAARTTPLQRAARPHLLE